MPTVELFGVLRIVGGISALKCSGGTIGACLAEVERRMPSLAGRILNNGKLSPAYRISIDANRFIDSLETSVPEDSAILVVAADLGG